jgi:AcrR family transcriptional regulator
MFALMNSISQAPTRLAASGPTVPKRPRGRPRKTAEELDDGNRRLQLLAAAARLFRRKGFDATTTRDIASAAGMQSGSPFYHFKTKGALLYAVMQEGMKSATLRQAEALRKAGPPQDARALLAVLVRNHFDVLLGAGSDFIPVMLYEWRSITARQRAQLAELQGQYEAPWLPVLRALHDKGQLKAEVKLARLLIFGALNWSVQWFDRKKGASPQMLADAALALFIHDEGALQ